MRGRDDSDEGVDEESKEMGDGRDGRAPLGGGRVRANDLGDDRPAQAGEAEEVGDEGCEIGKGLNGRSSEC